MLLYTQTPQVNLTKRPLLWSYKGIFYKTWFGRLNNGPKDVHILIPGIFEYVTMHGRKDFAGVIKLRSLRWEDYVVFSG